MSQLLIRVETAPPLGSSGRGGVAVFGARQPTAWEAWSRRRVASPRSRWLGSNCWALAQLQKAFLDDAVVKKHLQQATQARFKHICNRRHKFKFNVASSRCMWERKRTGRDNSQHARHQHMNQTQLAGSGSVAAMPHHARCSMASALPPSARTALHDASGSSGRFVRTSTRRKRGWLAAQRSHWKVV